MDYTPSFYSQLYNNAYVKFTPDYIKNENMDKINHFLEKNGQSLTTYLLKYMKDFSLYETLKTKTSLELGCGLGSLSFNLSEYFLSYTAIDNSSLAISMAREILKLKKNSIDFKIMDVCGEKLLEKKFDYIIDSHLLHCLPFKEQRIGYFKFVKAHLKEQGRLIVETMVFCPKIKVPVGYSFDEQYILSKSIDKKMVPVRAILKSIDIEKELAQAGFHIDYLYYHNEISFNPFDEYPDYSADFSPKTLRLAARIL